MRLTTWFSIYAVVATFVSAEPPLGLDEAPWDATRPELVELGRALFFDKALSSDGKVSCATCHEPEHAFAQSGVTMSAGVDGRKGRRNSPSLLNVGYVPKLFADGRVATLEEQAWEPLLDPDEMGNASAKDVLDRIAAAPRYAPLLNKAFGEKATPTRQGVAEALAAFQRSLVVGNAAYDRWNWGHDDAMTDRQLKGESLFGGQANCWQCHVLRGPNVLFTDQQFHDTGVAARSRALNKKAPVDLGRFEVTGESKDRFAFRTPSLRNVELTAPYMHDGSLATLRDVVVFYSEGHGPDLQVLDLSDDEIDALVAFLKSFTTPAAERLALSPAEAAGSKAP